MIELDFLRLLGIIYLSIGVSAFIDAKYIKNLFTDFVKEKSFVFLTGILTTILGYILIATSYGTNIQYSCLVYVLGVITLVKGILLLIYPKLFYKVASFYSNDRVFNILRILLVFIGIVCIYITVL